MTTQVESSNENQADNKPRRDIHQEVTDTIISQLEAGTAPWHKPWIGGDFNPFQIPINAKNKKAYRGINILLLWCASLNRQYASNEWNTINDWNQQKESIQKGERGSMIVKYDVMEKEVDGEIKKIPFVKYSIVFNRCQLKSYEPEAVNPSELPPLVERIDNVEIFVGNTGAKIKHSGYRACYVPAKDEIQMPTQNSFIDTEFSSATENYYSTLLHELSHWSGHSSRMDRKLSGKFGNVAYAEEELIAELSAAFLCAELEITNTPKPEHAQYIANWLSVLKQNKHAIFSAAASASKTVEFLKGLQPTVLIN